MNSNRACLLVIACAALSGCGTGGSFACTDSSVRTAALDAANEQVRDLILFDALGRHHLVEVALKHPKYAEFKARTDAPYVGEVVADVDRFLSSKKFSIEAMRAQSSSADSASLSCAGDFVMQGAEGTKKFPITYVVYQENGKIVRVDVSGL